MPFSAQCSHRSVGFRPPDAAVGLCGCFSSDAEEVRELDYRHNSLADVPGEVFTFERTLEELHLDANQISDLPVSLFHCHSLRYLGLSDNELQTLPPAVASLIHLHVLDVSKNAITTIPDNINGCKQLRSVDASVNPLSRLPDGFTQLISLQELYLSDTFLEYLPANFGRLSRLRILELRENRLTSLPKSMSRLTHLQRLDLGQNDLSELPEVVGSLTGLTELLCDFNKMSCLPPLLGQLTRLTHLDASNNKLRELPEELGRCTQLGYLQLSANNLRTIPESCGSLARLVTLKLDDNTLTSLPERLGQMAALQELNTSHNNLTRLPGSVGLLRALTDLNVDENLLQELPHELGSCVSLRVLSVRANRLSGVPAELGHLSLLRVLNLCSNRIAHLPCSFSKLHNLQALWLSPNQNTPLVQLQSETAARGQKVLTCFMLPQQSDPDYSEMPDRHDTLQLRPQQLAALEADLAARSHIKFAVERASEPLSPGRLLRAPTPYPKELKELAKHARNLQKLGRRPDQPPPPPPPSAQAGSAEQKPPKELESNGAESPFQPPPPDAPTPENVSGEPPDWGSWDGPDTKEAFVDGESPEPSPTEPVAVSSPAAEDSGEAQPGTPVVSGAAESRPPAVSSDVSSGTTAVSAAVSSAGVVPPLTGTSPAGPPQGTASRPWLPPAVGSPPPYHVAASQSRLAGEFAYRRMDPLRLLNTSLDVPAGQIPPPARLNETFDLADLRNTGTSWQHTPPNGSAHPLGSPSGMNGISRVPIEGPPRPEEPRPGGSPTKPRRASASRASGRFPRRSDEKLPIAVEDSFRAKESPSLMNESQTDAGGSPPELGNEPPKLLVGPPRPLRLESEESVSTPDGPTGNTDQEGPKIPEVGPVGDAADMARAEDICEKAPAGAAVDAGPGGGLVEGEHIIGTGSDGEAAGLLSTISQITDYDSSTSDSAAEPPPPPPPLPPPTTQRREPLRPPLASRIPRRQDSPSRQESPVRSENAAAAPVERGRTPRRQESPPPPPLPPPQGDGPPAGRPWQPEREPRVTQSSQLPVRVMSPLQQPAGGQPPALPARHKPAEAPGVLPLSREGSRSFLPMPRSRLESPQRTNGSPSGQTDRQTPSRVQAPASRTPTTQGAASTPVERVREPSYSQLPVPRSRHASPHQTNGLPRAARPAAGSLGSASVPLHQEGGRRGQLYSSAPSSSQLPMPVDAAVSALPRLAAPRQSPVAAGSRGSLSAGDAAGPAGSRRSVSSTLSASSSRIPVARAGVAVHPAPVAAPRHGWPPSNFAAPDAGYTQVDVTIEKSPGLGFSIAGGSGSDTSHKGVYISRVQADGGAWQLLRPGDRLLAVDGADLSAASHAHAVQALLHTGRTVQLRLLRPAQQ